MSVFLANEIRLKHETVPAGRSRQTGVPRYASSKTGARHSIHEWVAAADEQCIAWWGLEMERALHSTKT